jgi:hypothetical protein
MACAVESVVSRLSHTLSMGFRWNIRYMLETSKSSMPKMSKKELKAMKHLRLNKMEKPSTLADISTTFLAT